MEAAPADVDGASGSVRSLSEDSERVELEVEATRPTALVVLDGWALGWSATVNGVPAPVLRAGEHRAVWVGGGRSRVRLAYSPPGLRAGLALFALSAVIAVLARAYDRERAPVGSNTGRNSSR